MARGAQPDYLPSGADIHRLRSTKNEKGKLTSWEAIGNRFGVSRQAAYKKWKQWVDRQAKDGITIENPRPSKKDDVTTPASQITTGVDATSPPESTNASPITID